MTKSEIYGQRLFLAGFVLVIAIVTAVEFAVAINLKLTSALTRESDVAWKRFSGQQSF